MWPGSGDGPGRPSYCVSWPRWPSQVSQCVRAETSRVPSHLLLCDAIADWTAQTRSYSRAACRCELTTRRESRGKPSKRPLDGTDDGYRRARRCHAPKKKKKKEYLLTQSIQRLCAVMLMHAVITRWKDRSVTHRLGHPCPARVRTCNGRYAVNPSMLHTVARAHVVTLPLHIAPHTHTYIRIHTGRPSTAPGGGGAQSGFQPLDGSGRAPMLVR